jgi:diguanylate cyclase (GGDEF)-like protein
MTGVERRGEYTVLNDRMRHLFWVRIGIGFVVLVWAALRPELLGISSSDLAGLTGAYLSVAAALEFVRRRSVRFDHFLLSLLLLLDGVYLVAALYATGGMQSQIRFLIYLHVVALSLLASYRTGLKIAIWYSLLFLVLIYAQAAALIPAVDVTPGHDISIDQMPVVNVASLWLFALATSAFSAMNERELRQRRADLQALVDVGQRLDDEGDPTRQAQIVLDALAERFDFPRGVVVGASDEQLMVFAARGEVGVAPQDAPVDSIVRRSWERHALLPVKGLDPARNPLLAQVLAGARNLLVAPLVADGRPVGAIVLEYRRRHFGGVERRVASMIGQFASIAALNMRNAVLLKHVQELADRDALTGAANRRMFQVTLERVLQGDRARPGDKINAVLFVDLDDFKVVNDTLGHAAGDDLLVEVTRRIGRLVRSDDLVARLGGDEFAILTVDRPDLRRSRAIAERLVRELRAPYLIGETSVSVTASIGIASAADAIGGAPDLVRNADVAMYMAKANGKAGFAEFDPQMHLAIREQHELSVELQRVVELDQLRLEYQPIVDLRTGSVVGLEALVRWEHPDRGLIPPDRFIELAEENGAIIPIGRWVLREACREVGQFLRAGHLPADVFLSVNASAREIGQPGFIDGMEAALRDGGMPADRLMLEITETALLRATPQTLAALHRLRELGVRAVIDDFGTGHFSLSHLRQFPVDALKVASEFVHDAAADSRSSALASAIVAMGMALDLTTVAEGIETPDEAQRMAALGCVYGQGFFFGRPGPLQPIDDRQAATGRTTAPRTRRSRRASRLPEPVQLSPVPSLEVVSA